MVFSTPPQKLKQNDVNALMQLYAAGHYEKLEVLIQKLVKLYPRDPVLLNMMGATMTAQQRVDEAVSYFRQALALDFTAADTHSNLGTALKMQGKTEESIESYRQAIKYDPKHAGAYYNLAIALHTLGKHEEGIKKASEAIKLQPDYPKAYSNRGVFKQVTGDLEGARADFEKALKQQPKLAEAHYNLHTLQIDPGNMEPAIKSLKKAVGCAPTNESYHVFLGICLDYAGRPDEAQPHFEKIEKHARDLYKSRIDAWRYLKEQKPLPKMFGSPIDGFKMCVDAAPETGLVMEFGVRFGGSIRQIAALVDQDVHGFDSFEGLPEEWHSKDKGSYTTQGEIPPVPDNVTLHAGWFEDTLPPFAKEHTQSVRIMNIDCDIYSSTKTILDVFANQIVTGTVIIFDEYIGNRHWREDEYKAFQEAVKTYGWTYEYLGFSFVTKQVVVRITDVKA